jgi:hypothetical protein
VQYAATLALGHSTLELCELMLSDLTTFVEEVTSEMESRPKWKVGKIQWFRSFTSCHLSRPQAISLCDYVFSFSKSLNIRQFFSSWCYKLLGFVIYL